MKEKIVIIGSVNETSFLRMLALKGINTLGLRIMNPIELANEVLIRNGLTPKDKIISSALPAFIFNELSNNEYFEINKLHDARLFINSLNELRLNVLDESKFEDLVGDKAEFIYKNKAILEIYDIYKQKLEDNGYIDDIMEIKEVINSNLTIDANIFYVEEFALKPVEMELLKSVSNNTCEAFKITDKSYSVIEYVSSYGTTNECEYVLNTIFKNNYKLDECVVAVTEPTIYRKTFEDLSSVYNIPITFGVSKSIIDTNSGKLLKLLMELHNDCYSNKLFKKVIESEFVDKAKLYEIMGLESKNKDYESNKKYNLILNLCGGMRFSFDKEENDEKLMDFEALIDRNNDKEKEEVLFAVERIANIMSSGIVKFIENFVIMENVDKEQRAIEQIRNYLNYGKIFDIPKNIILEDILNLGIGKSNPEEGKLYVTTIKDAKETVRKHLFVCGLSALYYPGSPKENHILLDSDYEIFGIKNKSELEIKDKIDNYNKLLEIQGNGNIRLSYSSFSLADLKNQNASSLLFETFKKLNPNKTIDDLFGNKKKNTFGEIKEIKYFDSNITDNNYIGKSYIEGFNIVKSDTAQSITPLIKVKYKNSYSASLINEFFTCQYKFYLKNVVGLEDPFDEDSANVIAANDRGTLIHSVMEHNDELNSLDEYYELLEKEFKDYLIIHRPISSELASYELANLKNIIANAYNLVDKGAIVITKESDGYAYCNGIKIHGLPDLVIRDNTGKIKIIDYKIKGRVEHDVEDINTLMQILLYAYVFNSKSSERVDKCEYRYLIQGKNVTISNVNEKLLKFEENIKIFKNALDTNTFEKANKEGKDPCIYCHFKDICYKGVKEEE